MEVCQPPTLPSSTNNNSRMSLLDSLFGTDGRNRKDDGIWTWIKSQKLKKSKKSKHQMLTRSVTHTPETIHSNSLVRPVSSLSASSTLIPESSSSVSLSSYASKIIESTHPSTAFSSPPNIPATALVSPSSSTPINYSRQRTLSDREQSNRSSVLSSSISSISSGKSRQSTIQPSENSRFAEGPIKRSTSSRSAPAHTYYISSKTNNNSINNTNSNSSNHHYHQSHTNPHLRSMSHGEFENQIKMKGRVTTAMDDISEIAVNVAQDDAEKDKDQTNTSFRQQRWSSSDSPLTIHHYRELRRSDTSKRSSKNDNKNDGWWWE